LARREPNRYRAEAPRRDLGHRIRSGAPVRGNGVWAPATVFGCVVTMVPSLPMTAWSLR
jgi:hypothetical protein